MTIYGIAEEAGTSISTVSRVLNNKGNVNPEIRKRVEAVLKKYDYKPSAIARGMISKTMKSIAILTIDVRVTHYARMIYVIEQEFSNKGYNVTVCNTGGAIEECERYFKILAEKQVDGIILIGSVFDDLINYPDIIGQVRNIPIVVVNGYVNHPDFYSILVDDTKAIRIVVDYLFERGYRDLIYIFDTETDSGRAKRQGFLEGMKLKDVPDAERRVFVAPQGLDGGKAVAEEIIASGISFNGVVCGEDMTAIGVMKELKRQGYRVPQDIAVTGCNNSPESRVCEPELTTIDNKPELLGRLSAKLLQKTIEKKETAVNGVIQPELLVRAST